MHPNIYINDYEIQPTDFHILDTIRPAIRFTCIVTHEQYHAVTTLLYENDFLVNVPSHQLSFSATIKSYATSVTNLYEEGAEGEFTIELTEKDQ